MASMPMPQFPPGQQPSPQQIQAMQQQFLAEAQRQGLTPQQFMEKLRAQAMAQQQAMMQAQQQGGQLPPGMMRPGQPMPGQPLQPGQQPGQPGQPGQPVGQQAPPQQQQPPAAPAQGTARPGQQVPITPGPPKPEALAIAKFLRSQKLKERPCILQEKRRELFKVKRAIRALESPAYEKARAKNPLLPAITDRASAENTFKLLPISMLALRVSKLDPANNAPHGAPGHQHGAGKKIKGVWNVKIEPQQEADDSYHYVWFYEGTQWRQKAYAALGLLAVVAIVLFPLWPYTLRRGVWYLSMGALGLLAAFFGLAIVRLIIYLITIVTVRPGIWIYPNLFEDVGFFDSFRPGWAWVETKESLAAKKVAKKEKKAAKKLKGKVSAENGPAQSQNTPVINPADVPAEDPGAEAESTVSGTSGTTGASVASTDGMTRRHMGPRIEEVEDDE